MFSVGDRVQCVEQHDGNRYIVGKIGTVKYTKSNYNHIEFDERIPHGHDCARTCRYGYGWGIPDEKLILLSEDIPFNKDEYLSILGG